MKERFEAWRRFALQNLVVGMIIVVPLAVTIWALLALFEFSDQLLFQFLPPALRPDAIFGFRVPGLGILLSLLLIFGAGFMARNYLGKQALAVVERVFSSIPVLRGIYRAIRQFMESLFVDRSQAFRKVVLLEYPRRGLYTIAFVTGGIEPEELHANLPRGERLRTVFVPTTPNPTSGFLLFVPESELLELPMRVDAAFRLVVSGGVLTATSKADLFERLESRRRGTDSAAGADTKGASA